MRIFNTANTSIPAVQLLSNGKYQVMITNAGGGYSRWKDIAVTRWREDATCDNWGTFFYIRDTDSGEYWSNTCQPALKSKDVQETEFSSGCAEFYMAQDDISAATQVFVAQEDDMEVRRITITNNSANSRTIEITSYAEVVIAAPASDAAQPAFSNLFVQTEILADQQAILCTRRPSADDHAPCMFHTAVLQNADGAEISYETDRMEFLGHGNTPAIPLAMTKPGPLAGNEGSVLDPIVSIRYKIILEAGANAHIDFITGVSETKELCEKVLAKYKDATAIDNAYDLAVTNSRDILRQANITEADEDIFGGLAGSLIFVNPALRAYPSVISANTQGQSGLWGYSISGDLPIVLLQMADESSIPVLKQLLQARNYWQLKGLNTEVVIWNENTGSSREDLQRQILGLIPGELLNKPGGIFVREGDKVAPADRILFQTVARIIIGTTVTSLADLVVNKENVRSESISQKPVVAAGYGSLTVPGDLLLFNGLGGFSPDGKEYVIAIDKENTTPAPWVNVIANPGFGTVVTESGQAYTWAENAHEMRLTPWNNDIVTESAGELFYLRDEASGHFWSPVAVPAGIASTYITRHGFGYSIFEHIENGIHSEMTVFVDIAAPVKFTILKLRNDSGAACRLSATGYTEWVLGDIKPKTAMYVVTETGDIPGAVFARNPYNTSFPGRTAFFHAAEAHSITGDRAEFIGRNGSLRDPAGMHHTELSGTTGAALDPCAAIRVYLDLEPGEEREVIFKLGAAPDRGKAQELVTQFRTAADAHKSLEQARAYWQNITSALQIETPDTALNIITNGWLTYQALSCRLWGRSGYYQSGGAFGFRDQLQDVLSLLHAAPELARKQIALSASRQFPEGDVQHWWHPPTGQGVRTRISDDYLFLPYVTSRYITYTGDAAILDEVIPFLKGRPLKDGEESYYELPAPSDESGTLYDHCVRAIRHCLKFGTHGIPLMGTGDWNDGMNRVGHDGKGESIWLGFFLYDNLIRFSEIASFHNDPDFAAQCTKEADMLSENIEQNGWDGEWYRRAYFDDGTPLGSASNTECKIDAIAQSWSVLSGAGNKERTLQAMESVDKFLVNKDASIIELLAPPFDNPAKDPGYIKGYVPGVRENGGQYTHAAVWTIMAFAQLGDRKRTWELLRMINPLNHSDTKEKIATYKVEPYVLAGDVYALEPHTGRGGWTWYSGSASWLYQLITESFLGLHTEADKLRFDPCIPAEWELFKVHYRYRDTLYHITVKQQSAKDEMTVVVDGETKIDNTVLLINDSKVHHVEVLVG